MTVFIGSELSGIGKLTQTVETDVLIYNMDFYDLLMKASLFKVDGQNISIMLQDEIKQKVIFSFNNYTIRKN